MPIQVTQNIHVTAAARPLADMQQVLECFQAFDNHVWRCKHSGDDQQYAVLTPNGRQTTVLGHVTRTMHRMQTDCNEHSCDAVYATRRLD